MVTRLPNFLKLGLGIAALATVCSAAGSVASVTSAQPFNVDGIQVSSPGVNSWPLISSDEVSTTVGAALMTFRDGSAIQLAPQSRVRLAGTTTAPEVILLAGNLDTKLAPGSKLLVTRETPDNAGDKDNGGVPDSSLTQTGARANNNTPFRKAALLYTSTSAALGLLGLAVDAILQPTSVSPR
jgi:hypothetical protein